MKVLVPIKRVVDYQVKIHVKPDGTGIDSDHLKMSMNPFDEIAVEEAVRWKEHGLVEEIVVVSIGKMECQETLRVALAMGADRAILLTAADVMEFIPLTIAKILAAVCRQEQPQLVILGKQAIDDDCNQTGQMLAGLLAWPQGTFISKLELTHGHATVIREIDGGLETLKLNLPAVVTTDLRLNQPRYSSLPNIMKAKQKPLEIRPVAELNLNLVKHIETLRIDPPEERKTGVKVKDIAELMNKLKLAKVLP